MIFNKSNLEKEIEKAFESFISTKQLNPSVLMKKKDDSGETEEETITEELRQILTARELHGYSIEKRISKGGFGELFLARKENNHYIIKVPRTKEHLWTIKNEMEILNKLGQFTAIQPHKNIVGIHESYENFLVLEYLETSIDPLKKKTKGLTEIIKKDSSLHPNYVNPTRVAKVFVNVIDALEFCHKEGVFHCDVKESNLLFTHGYEEEKERKRIYTTAKLFDFGISFKMDWLNNSEELKEKYREGATLNYLHKDYLKEREKWGNFPDEIPSKKRIFSAFKRRDYAALAFTIYNLLTYKSPYEEAFDRKDIPVREIYGKFNPIDESVFQYTNNGDFFLECINMCLNPMSFSEEKNIGRELKERLIHAYPIIEEKS